MKELEKDMSLLRAGMKEVERELEFYRGQEILSGDRYIQEILSGDRYIQEILSGDRDIQETGTFRRQVHSGYPFRFFKDSKKKFQN